METYAIGDVHGCYDELQELLQLIDFQPDTHCLWFTGDLVNRGPDSLAVLRFVKALPHKVVVLGNHDIHLLAIANGHLFKDHSLHSLLTAEDKAELLQWLRQQPLVHYDAELGYALLHAGTLPQWSIQETQDHANEVTSFLRGDKHPQLLEHLYGKQPNQWSDHLSGWERLRFITSVLTRLRFCNAQGTLDLTTKGQLGAQPAGYLPWFQIPSRKTRSINIIFGHWAALNGETHTAHAHALDTGCVWGGALTAMRLSDQKRFSVRSRVAKS